LESGSQDVIDSANSIIFFIVGEHLSNKNFDDENDMFNNDYKREELA